MTKQIDTQHGAFSHICLDDIDAARELLSHKYRPHGLRALSRSERFDFVHISTPVPVGSFNILRYGAQVEITPETFDDFFMLEMPLQGHASVESVGRRSAQSAANKALFLPPHVRMSSVWEANTLQLMLQVRKEVVLERWQSMCGDATLQLPKVFPEIDLDTPEGWRIRKLLLLISEELRNSVSRADTALAETPLAAATVDATLAYFRRYQTTMVEDGASVLPSHLRACVRRIHADPAADHSVPALLGHTDVSERTLFKLFRTFLHKSPRAYVESVRLKHARRRLLEGAGVAQAARASGFGHMGRFAARYEETYGEKPSRTAARRSPDPAGRSDP